MANNSIEIHRSTMSEDMKQGALQVALLAIAMNTEGNAIASYIMKEFDRKHGRYWHCFLGNSGCSVQDKKNSFIDFSVGNKRITLFKTD